MPDPAPSAEVSAKPIEILLVDDSAEDVELTLEALKDSKILNRISVARDGVEALEFLRKKGRFAGAPTPDLVLLDLHMPRKDGKQVLAEVKSDPVLKTIPVIILTTSSAHEDVLRSYGLQANAYVVKPVDFMGLVAVVRAIDSFWLQVAQFPPR